MNFLIKSRKLEFRVRHGYAHESVEGVYPKVSFFLVGSAEMVLALFSEHFKAILELLHKSFVFSNSIYGYYVFPVDSLEVF